MAGAYSQDLRDRVIDAVAHGGMSRRSAAASGSRALAIPLRSSGLSVFSGRACGPPEQRAATSEQKLEPYREFLEACHAEKPDVTLQALCDRLLAERAASRPTHR